MAELMPEFIPLDSDSDASSEDSDSSGDDSSEEEFDVSSYLGAPAFAFVALACKWPSKQLVSDPCACLL